MKWWYILLGFAAIITLRIAGFIESIWIGAGISILVGIVVLIQKLPAWRRLISAIFIGWVTIFLLFPLLSKTWYLFQESEEQRKVHEDLRMAEKIHPPGTKAWLGLRAWCNDIEDLQSSQINQKFEKLFDLYRRNQIPLEVMERRDLELRQKIKSLTIWRKECGEFILMNASPQLPQTKDKAYQLWEKIKSVPDMPRRPLIWSLVFILISATVIATLTGSKALSRAAWGLAILFLVAILTDWVIWGSGWQKINEVAAIEYPTRPLAGAFEVPAGKMVRTSLFYRAGEQIQLTSNGGVFWISGIRKDIKITRVQELLSPALIGGEIQIKGGPEPVRVQVQIIPN